MSSWVIGNEYCPTCLLLRFLSCYNLCETHYFLYWRNERWIMKLSSLLNQEKFNFFQKLINNFYFYLFVSRNFPYTLRLIPYDILFLIRRRIRILFLMIRQSLILSRTHSLPSITWILADEKRNVTRDIIIPAITSHMCAQPHKLLIVN